MTDPSRIEPRGELERLQTQDWQEHIRSVIHDLQNAADDLAFALQAHFAYGKRV